MCILLYLVVISLFQVFALEQPLSTHIYKRSPQQYDIQSISQKKISPDITVVDVVVNEPSRNQYPNQNRYIQPGYQPQQYPRPNNNFNYYPNGQYQNVPNRRQPEIQIIEVVDPTPNTGNNYQQWQRYPNQEVGYPNNPGQYGRGPPNFPGQGNGPYNRPNRPHRRRYRPTPDFYIIEDNQESLPPPRDNRRPRPRDRDPERKPRPNQNNSSDDSEEDKYVFDAGDDDQEQKYTKDNFPIIPLHKNDIR